ncbi:MAG TPA: hypothetical protein VNF47_13285 [Streptosporangiaceae bacterium]|nr:hypothetical protein [Streptosporangiaceae bacterium]
MSLPDVGVKVGLEWWANASATCIAAAHDGPGGTTQHITPVGRARL